MYDRRKPLHATYLDEHHSSCGSAGEHTTLYSTGYTRCLRAPFEDVRPHREQNNPPSFTRNIPLDIMGPFPPGVRVDRFLSDFFRANGRDMVLACQIVHIYS